VRLIGRVCGAESGVDTCLQVDKANRRVILDEPGVQLSSCSQRQRSSAANTGPRLFVFDDVFGPGDSLVGVRLVKLIAAEWASSLVNIAVAGLQLN